MLEVKDIICDFRLGSSLPVLVATSSSPFVIKWKGAGEGPVVNAIDWVALHLAGLLGIRVPEPVLIHVGPELENRTNDAEIRDLIRFSQGLNLAIPYLENAEIYNHKVHCQIKQEEKERIFLFDLLLLNIDRIDINPNMLVVDEHLICIDFAAAIAIKSCIHNFAFNEINLLQRLKHHPFYSQSARATFNLDREGQSALAEAVATIPGEWFRNEGLIDSEMKKRVAHRLADMVNASATIIKKRLEILDGLPEETAADARARSRRNSIAFQLKHSRSYELK